MDTRTIDFTNIQTTEEADYLLRISGFEDVDDYEFDAVTGDHYYFLEDGRCVIIARDGELLSLEADELD